jgi:formylglycine-generating enzyme required for sulfatase activity
MLIRQILLLVFFSFFISQSTFAYNAGEVDKPSKPASSLQFNQQEVDEILQSMVHVEGGDFIMGTDDKNAPQSSKPAHNVTLNSFYIGKTEVTQKLFEKVAGWNFSYFPCNDCPVNNISWMNIHSFLNKLNMLTGKKFRLPTEAEWAYAAKGGTRTLGYTYSGSNNISEVAWYSGNAEQRSHPVAQKKPNELGLYDMTGNLCEFVRDDMMMNLYTKSPRVNPFFSINKPIKFTSLKVTRGSCYEFDADESQLYRRDGATSNVRMPDIGFRLALDSNRDKK